METSGIGGSSDIPDLPTPTPTTRVPGVGGSGDVPVFPTPTPTSITPQAAYNNLQEALNANPPDKNTINAALKAYEQATNQNPPFAEGSLMSTITNEINSGNYMGPKSASSNLQINADMSGLQPNFPGGRLPYP